MARPGRPPKEKPNLHPLVDSFLDMLTTERGAAMNTRQAYWRDLADFSLYLRDSFSKEIVDVTTDEIKSYLKDLGNKIHVKGENRAQIATRTVARRLSALRQFYRYLVSENIRKEDQPTGNDDQEGTQYVPEISSNEVDQLTHDKKLAIKINFPHFLLSHLPLS